MTPQSSPRLSDTVVVFSESRPHAHALDLLRRLPFEGRPAVRLLTVLDPAPPFGWTDVFANESEHGTWRELREQRQAELRGAVAKHADDLEREGWTVRSKSHEGPLAAELLSDLEAAGGDLVALDCVGAGKGDEQLLRLDAEGKKVLAQAPCSVLIGRPRSERERGDPESAELEVLVALDGSDHSHAAVDLLASLPWGPKTRFTLLTVMTVATTLYRQDLLERLQGTWALHRSLAEAELDAAAERLSATGARVSTKLLDGGSDPTDEILDAAALLEADLLVVGSHGRSRWKEVLLGSVSSQLVQSAPCSVLVVKTGAPAAESN